MSSKEKDARWQIALSIVEDAGIDWDDLDFRTRTQLLERAQMFLSILGPQATEALAQRFKEED